MAQYDPNQPWLDPNSYSLGDEAAAAFAAQALTNGDRDKKPKELIQLGWQECCLRAQARESVLRQLLGESTPFLGLLDKRQIGKLLNLSTTAIERLRDRRVIPSYKVGGAVRFRYPEVLKALERYRIREVQL